MAAIWADVLRVERVGLRDDFFALGGVSLSAIRALGRIRTAFGIDVPVRCFFETPTVEAISAVIEERLLEEIEAMSDDEVRQALDGRAG